MSSGNALDIFALRDSIVDEYKQFATSFTDICDPDLRRQIDAIYNEEKYWPEPLLQINPNYCPARVRHGEHCLLDIEAKGSESQNRDVIRMWLRL